MCTWNPATRKLFVDGLNIVNPRERPEAFLSPEDFCLRETAWIRQITVHTTGGHWPQPIRPGAGPATHAALIAKSWQKNPEHGGAPFVIDFDGTVWLLIDPFKYAVFHATTVNDWSIGIEMCTMPDGSIFEATLQACRKLVKALCQLCGIPFQTSSVPWKSNHVIKRLKDGGKYVVGVFGHHDNAWKFPWQLAPAKRGAYPQGYADRGRGDPGDEIKRLLKIDGALQFDYDKGEDLAFWKPVQRAFNDVYSLKLDVDGVYGPSLHTAMVKFGYWQEFGIFAERPMPSLSA